MSKSEMRFYVALFIASVVVFSVSKRDELSALRAPIERPGDDTLAVVAAPGQASSSGVEDRNRMIAGHTSAQQQQASSQPVPGNASPEALEFAQDLQTLSTAAIAAADADDRAVAVQQLSGTRTPETLSALSQVTLQDRETRNRYLAVESLRLLALNQGDEDGGIRAVLRLAANDRDAEVARHARESLQDLANTLGT